ncbi:MAG: radical SAM protein [Actinomycetota bacterium]|nr:radical SAM protein [Actinomycetota bacterium]
MIFTNVVKPTHLCNLACTYCYNDDVRRPVMSDDVLTRTIDQTFAYVEDHFPQRLVSFIWHGGEPMVAGLRFFERAVDLQRKHATSVVFDNSIQTNGTLIDDRWLDFFGENRFSVSISIDGPQDLHDRYRVDRQGRGSFQRVQEAIARVKEAGLPLGVCVVISRANVDRVDEIFEFLAAERLRFNVIPLNRSGGAREHFDDVGLAADEYAPAWIRMYDRWFDSDERDYVYCSDFVYKTRAIMAGRPADCVGLEQCGETNIAVDPVGDVFACATLSGSTGTKYGNIVDADLDSILDTPIAREYRHRRTDEQCSRCRWQHVCHGGCQARAYKFFGDHHRRDYYCPSLFRIYEHIAERVSTKLGFSFTPADEHPQPRLSVGDAEVATARELVAAGVVREATTSCSGCAGAIDRPTPALMSIGFSGSSRKGDGNAR